jgi:hypothetical protein
MNYILYLITYDIEDTKGIIRIHKSKKDRQHNGQRKKYVTGQTTTYIVLYKIYFFLLSWNFHLVIVVMSKGEWRVDIILRKWLQKTTNGLHWFIDHGRMLRRLLHTFSFGHCVVCPSSIYGFWLSLWYLQTLLETSHRIVELILHASTCIASVFRLSILDCPFGFL